MHHHLALLLCLLAGDVTAAVWQPTDSLLHAVRAVESAEGLLTWGDNGQSLGDFQLSEAAWVDVSAWRRAHHLPTYNYDVHVWNREVSRLYAADYLSILQRELKKRLGRTPSPAEIYAAYNMGLASFARCQYRLARVNPLTAEKCHQINAILARR